MNATKHADIVPPTLKRHAFALIQVTLLVNHSCFRVHKTTFAFESLHAVFAITPCARNALPRINWASFCFAARTGYVSFVVATSSPLLHVSIPTIDCGFRKRLVDRTEGVFLR